LLRFLINEAETRQDDLPLTALSEIEEELMVMFLKANRHNFSHLLDRRCRDVAPWQVRLVEDYIEAHWDQPITIEAVAQVVHASARSIFDSFRKSRGHSPMAFVKQVRLRHARQMLTSPEPGTTVASVACYCGFGNLGNFAKDYRKAFGELPSETLRLVRGMVSPR
jgi:transcriptional regulator GlxA family with amidase domain